MDATCPPALFKIVDLTKFNPTGSYRITMIEQSRFNTYRFADHKEELITLLKRVTTVWVETLRLRRELEQMEWEPQPKLEFIAKPDKSKKAVTKHTGQRLRPAPMQGKIDGTEQERLF